METHESRATETIGESVGLSKHDIRRNMLFCILLDTIWLTGYTDFQLALQPLLVYLHASNKVIAFVFGATWLALPGMFITPWITRRFPIKKWYLFVVNMPYMGSVGIAGLLVVLSRQLDISDVTLMLVVVGSVLAQNFFAGFVALPHQEYVAACIPASHRGRYSGLSVSLGAVFSVGSTAIAGVILYKLAKPMSFGYLFLMTWVICQGGYWFAVFAKERPTPVEASPKPWSKGMLQAFWNDKPFVRFLIAWAIPSVTYGPIGAFTMIYGMKVLHMPAYTVATVGVVALIVRAAGAAPSGVIVDRLGAKRMLSIYPLAIGLNFAMLYLWHSQWAIYTGTVVIGLVGIVANMAKAVLQYGLPKPENRAGHYTMQLLADYGIGPIGLAWVGFLLDAVSYRTAFGIAAVGAFVYYPIILWIIRPLSDKVQDYS
jgi:hypothetical protein